MWQKERIITEVQMMTPSESEEPSLSERAGEEKGEGM